MAERLPPGAYDIESIKLAYLPNGLGVDQNGERHSRSDSITSTGTESAVLNGTHVLYSPRDSSANSEASMAITRGERFGGNGALDHSDARASNGGNQTDGNDAASLQDGDSEMRSRNPASPGNGNQVEAEWIDQYEPGVYITLVALRDGARDLKRVRFRYCGIQLGFSLYSLIEFKYLVPFI